MDYLTIITIASVTGGVLSVWILCIKQKKDPYTTTLAYVITLAMILFSIYSAYEAGD